MIDTGVEIKKKVLVIFYKINHQINKIILIV